MLLAATMLAATVLAAIPAVAQGALVVGERPVVMMASLLRSLLPPTRLLPPKRVRVRTLRLGSKASFQTRAEYHPWH